MPETSNNYSENCDWYKLSPEEFKFFSNIFEKVNSYQGKDKRGRPTDVMIKQVVQPGGLLGRNKVAEIKTYPCKPSKDNNLRFMIVTEQQNGYLELDSENHMLKWVDHTTFINNYYDLKNNRKNKDRRESKPCTQEEVTYRKNILKQCFSRIARWKAYRKRLIWKNFE